MNSLTSENKSNKIQTFRRIELIQFLYVFACIASRSLRSLPIFNRSNLSLSTIKSPVKLIVVYDCDLFLHSLTEIGQDIDI